MKTTMVVLTNFNEEPYASKFFQPIGPNGELLLEYTFYDAIASGFGRAVIIANEDISGIIKTRIESLFRGKIEILWADLKLPSFFNLQKRIPYEYFDQSTYALWKVKKYLTHPFLVVDAKYYYGKRSFEKAQHFLTTNKNDFSSINLPLGKTLSPYGGVDRSICLIKKNGLELKKIVALEKIRKMNGSIGCLDLENSVLSEEIPTTYMYCLNNRFFEAYKGLHKSVKKSTKIPPKKIAIPNLINFMVKRKMVRVKVLMVDINWLGTQFKHERILAKYKIKSLIARKMYPKDLGQSLSMI